MSRKYLEDIVAEDLKDKNSIAARAGSFLRKTFDMGIVRHPIATSTLVYAVTEYLRRNGVYFEHVQEPVLASLFVYSSLGLFKEYILEGRTLAAKSVSEWIVNNPKIAALAAAVVTGKITFNSEMQMQDSFSRYPYELGFAHGMATLLFAEAVLRAIKTTAKIKKAAQKIKKNYVERLWNFVWEHPTLPTVLTFGGLFYSNYNLRSSQNNGSGFLTGNLLEDLVNNSGAIISTATHAGVQTAATLGLTLLAGSVLHTDSLRELGLRASKLFSSQEERIKKQKKIVALPNSTESTIEEIVELGKTLIVEIEVSSTNELCNDACNSRYCSESDVRRFTKIE